MDIYSAFLHTPAWERFQRAAGVEVERLGETLYIKRTVPRGTYWQSSRCPISADWTLPTWAKAGWFLKLEPDTIASLSHLTAYAQREKMLLLPSIAYQPRQTSVIDIASSEEDILAKMKPKHRYNIRVAEKHGVSVHVFHEDSSAQMPRFLNLLKQTANRHDFHTHAGKYYQQMVEQLEPDQMIHLAIARYQEQDIAALLLITNGPVATYLHGASTYEHREVMAPYLLHLEAIRFAKTQGCTAYDLWGTHAVQTSEGDWTHQEGHASAGTTRFKLGFGGDIITYPGTYDLVIRPVQYKLYSTIKALRSRKRAFS